MEDGQFLGVTGAPYPERRALILPNFYTLLTYNDQIWHGNTHGARRVLGSETSLHIAQMRRAICQR